MYSGKYELGKQIDDPNSEFSVGLGRFLKKRFQLQLRFLVIKRVGIPDSKETPAPFAKY